MKGIAKVPKRRRLDAEERALMIAASIASYRSGELGAQEEQRNSSSIFPGRRRIVLVTRIVTS